MPTPIRALAAGGLGLALALAAASPALGGKPVLSEGHVDVFGIAYEDGALDLHVHDEETDTEYAPGDVVLKANAASETVVPDDPAYAFLGAPGDDVWILPDVDEPGLLFAGWATEEVPAGTFTNDALRVEVLGVYGSGDLSLYTVDDFGTPTVLTNSADGGRDGFPVTAGGHGHLNWAFSDDGWYAVKVKASGALADGSGTVATTAWYTFTVEDAPESSVATADFTTNAVTLSQGHVDVLDADHASGSLTLQVNDDTGASPVERAPADVVLNVLPEAKTTVPSGSQWSFLGTAGATIWVLPRVEDPDVLWPGFNTEEIASGVFTNNQVSFRLVSLNGPGNIAVYRPNSSGTPTVFYNSGNGLPDAYAMATGSHAHETWAFTASGTYAAVFEVTGTLAAGGTASSGQLTYTFTVQP